MSAFARIVCTLALMWQVSHEVGRWTLIVLSLLLLEVELRSWHERRRDRLFDEQMAVSMGHWQRVREALGIAHDSHTGRNLQ